jgi:beta-phosphoglucomutase-like phosphatase (HAD superfamily)
MHAAIFDLDGTLVDSYDAHFEAWRLISARHGVAVTVDDYYSHFGRRNEDLLRECWLRAGRGQLTPDEISALDHEKEAAYREIVAVRFPIMDGARELVASLRAADPSGERVVPTLLRRLAVVSHRYVQQRKANAGRLYLTRHAPWRTRSGG